MHRQMLYSVYKYRCEKWKKLVGHVEVWCTSRQPHEIHVKENTALDIIWSLDSRRIDVNEYGLYRPSAGWGDASRRRGTKLPFE